MESQSVRVAVNIRPLVAAELLAGCADCISVTTGEPQVQVGSHAFTFDSVYGSTGSASSGIFDDCVAPLVDALFHGYNATVLAYGQTGSGKTYTMGTNYNEECSSGIIPKVMQTIFKRVEETKGTTEFLIRVSFIEIFKEEVYDLLVSTPTIHPKADGNVKPVGPSTAPIQIRETADGGIYLAGVTEAEVTSQEEMASYLLRGSVCRATASTDTNNHSSRSHAIFTISMEQKKLTGITNGAVNDDAGDDILRAKLHLVDLAGSERAKKTGADGIRLREGIHINKGLLALGNVISALGDDKKRKEGGHVPYRDSKLTRLLQVRTLLGGNSKTVMIACVSPADTNAEETLNTLKYANRARNIQNKAVVNRDPVTTQMQIMKSQIEQLQAGHSYVKGDSSIPFEELQILKQKIALLERSNADLQRQLQEQKVSFEHLTKQALDAQDVDLLKTCTSKVELRELQLLRRLNAIKRIELIDYMDLDEFALQPESSLFPEYDNEATEVVGDFEDVEKELQHCSLQEKLDNELTELDKRLERKEAEMKQFASVDTSVPTQHYEKKVQELEQEQRHMQKEIEQLRCNLTIISSISDDSAQNLKENYIQKLKILESQVVELQKKQDVQAELLRQKQKSDEAEKNLQDEIHRIKTQKVQLEHKIKQESEQFRLWKASREKEVLQLKKVERRNDYDMHKLPALNQRQKMVLQQKTKEASMATNQLKELLESQKASSSDTLGNNDPGAQVDLKTAQPVTKDRVVILLSNDGKRKPLSNIGNKIGLRDSVSYDCSESQSSEVLTTTKIITKDATETKAQKTSPNETVDSNTFQKTSYGICCTCTKGSFCKTKGCECRAGDRLCSTSCRCLPRKCINREPVLVPNAVGDSSMINKPSPVICCSCIRTTFCKTMKCECRANGSSCSMSCSCLPKNCINREAVAVQPVAPVTKDAVVILLSDDEDVDENNSEFSLSCHLNLRPKGLRNSAAYNCSGSLYDSLEDIELHESENSELRETVAE